MDISLICVLSLSAMAFTAIGFYAGSKVKIIEIRENETVRYTNSETINTAVESYLSEEDAVVPGEED